MIGDVYGDLQGYCTQLAFPHKDLGREYTAIVNSVLEAAADSETMAVLLDIDVFCVKPFPMDLQTIWDELNLLGKRKNKMFEAAITDQVRRMIE